MKAIVVFIAGAMFLSSAIASDPGFEERFKMKTGRYTPAEEARRVKATASAKAEKGTSCDKHGCCSRKEQVAATATQGDPFAETRFKSKFGRNTPAEEARLAAAKTKTMETVLAAAATNCDSDCCKHHM